VIQGPVLRLALADFGGTFGFPRGWRRYRSLRADSYRLRDRGARCSSL